MDDIAVRDATRVDIEQILELLYGLGRPRPERDHDVFKGLIMRYISDSDKALLVAVRGAAVVGVASAILLSRLNRITPEMYIPELAVLEECRRMGIGRGLIEACIVLAREKKCHRIRLESGGWRKESHRFYLSVGFEQSSLSFSMSLE